MSNYHTTRAGFRYLRNLTGARAEVQKKDRERDAQMKKWATEGRERLTASLTPAEREVLRARLKQQVKALPDKGRKQRRS